MIKTFLISTLLFLSIASSALALSIENADGNVWFDRMPTELGERPAIATGDDILIYARLNNTTKDAITYTVSFTTVPEPIGTKTATVPAYTEQSVSVQWLMPEAPLIATATITKAVDKNKKEITSLKDTVIGTVALSNTPDLPKLGNVKGFFNKALARLEAWRLKQLDYFTDLKKKSESVLGTTTLKDLSDVFKPDVPGAPETEAIAIPDQNRQMGEYAKLVYATVGMYYFAHKAFFYISIVLLGLFILRFLFSRFL